MHNMQDHMRQQYEQQQAAYGQQQVPKDPSKQQKPTDRGEYIDFEEIK
jgi:ribosomal protein L44E